VFRLTYKQLLIREIESLPPQIVEEVYNFISFLKIKNTERSDITLASEKALAKDWLLPEEDLAWADL